MPELALYPREPRIRWDYAAINELLLWATHCGMSDLCLRSGLPAWMRLNGLWQKVTQRAITTDELLAALERLTKNNSVAALIKSGQSDYDFAHEIEETRGLRRRFRGNATPVADGYSTGVKIVFRAIPSAPPALEDLHVEQAILDHAMPPNGLVLVTGVMGSGKSTLLAAILRRIIENGGRNVSTYEAPIEFDFDAVPNPGGPVSQSTVPEHLKSFLTATRNSTRTAPDVVLIGESRDPDTLRGMIESAEIGVAAYSTVHTRSVPETLSRIINVFPVEERLQVTATLLSSLRLIISQRLVPLPDNSGRIALREYLAFTPNIRETLLDMPLERLILKTEELLAASGQRIQDAASAAFADGKLAKDKYLSILAERKPKGGTSYGATA
jgi:defect in organelle trafficking protein DotB